MPDSVFHRSVKILVASISSEDGREAKVEMLKSFAETNKDGLRKIAKKYDKRGAQNPAADTKLQVNTPAG